MADAPTVAPAPAAQAPPPTPAPTPAPATPAPAAQVPPAPTPAPVQPTPSPSNVVKLEEAPPTPADPFASLTPENKQVVEKSGFKSLDAVVESYNSLRNELRNKGIGGDLPDNATPEQREEWSKGRGRPDLASNYTLSMPQEMPKDMPYDGTFAETFKEWSHEVGLTPWQANALHAKYVAKMASVFTESGTKVTGDMKAAHEELTKTWGPEGSDQYNKNVEMATRAMRHLDPGLSDALKEVGLLTTEGIVMKASVAKALANAGHKLYSEDVLYGSGESSINNPWAKGKENLTEQGRIYRADPDRARRLARAAGANVNF